MFYSTFNVFHPDTGELLLAAGEQCSISYMQYLAGLERGSLKR